MSDQKPTPDDILAQSEEPTSPTRTVIPWTVLQEALREAIRQRNMEHDRAIAERDEGARLSSLALDGQEQIDTLEAQVEYLKAEGYQEAERYYAWIRPQVESLIVDNECLLKERDEARAALTWWERHDAERAELCKPGSEK